MKTIGFATKFYTLWDVTTEDLFTTAVTANWVSHYKSGTRYICTYIKNVSTSLDKVHKLYPDTPINENLRGHSTSFEWTSGNSGIVYGDDVFSRGYNKGLPIIECNSIKDLQWALGNEYDPDRRANIEAQMIKLGMVKFEGYMYDSQEQVDQIIADRQRHDQARLHAEEVYSRFSNGGVYELVMAKNLTSQGRYFDVEGGVSIIFKDFKLCYYNGFEYGLPTIGGTGKKVKGKTLKLTCRTVEDTWSEYGGQVLLVEGFEIV